MSIAEELSPVYKTPEDETTITPKVEFPEELPQKMTDPLGEEFKQKAYKAEEVIQAERDAEREAEAEAERQSRREVMGAIERDLLDPRDRTNGEKVSAISKFISASGGKAIRSEAQFNQGMDRAWKALGGEGIAPSTDAVFDKLQQQSIKGKQVNDKATDMFHRGTKSVYSKAPVDPTFELMTTPMSKEERKQFSEAYKKGVAAQRARLGDANIASYHTILEQVNTGIDFDEIAESVADHTVGMDGRAKITYLAGMRESLDELPQEKRQSLIDKIAHNARVSMELSGDLVTHTAKQAIKGVRGAAAGFFNESQRETNPLAKRAQLLSETAMHYTDMERSVKDILMSKAEPLDYVTDENSIGRFFEEAAYQVPQVAVSIGTVAAPMILSGVVGVGGYALQAARGASAVAGFSMSASEVAESKRQGYLEGGADFDTASKKSNSLATYAQTLPHYFLERFQGGAITRKSKFADTLMNKLDSKLRNRAARFVSKYTAQATIQTAEEMGQNIYTEMVKDITNVFDSEMSDVVWSNGKDGVFDEFWAQSAVTFLSMSPFAAGSAAGLMNADNRAAAWAKLPDLHLKAYGFDQQSIDNLKNAETPREKTRAYTDAQAIRDGFSEEAKEAIDIINTAAEAQAEALLQEQYTGDFPMVNVSFVDGKPSFKVYEPKTDELLLDTDNSTEATAAALEWADKKADEDDARFIFLNSLMKASEKMTERDPKSVKRLDTGEIMTALKAMAQDPEQANRVFSQAQKEEIRNGGDGDIANLVFGKRVYGSNRMSIDESRQIKLIDTIYAGGNIMTLIHEEGHGLFKTGVETGVIDYNDTIRLLRSLDKVMGDRMSKATSFGKSKTEAQPLRFLDTDGEPSFMQVDEAVAELWETLILGEGRMGSMRELIKANMKAQAQMGVGNTITNFIRALRHSMGLALTRAMVIKKAVRDGDIKKEDIDKFRAQMQGTTEQEQITDAAKKEFDKTLKPAVDELSMSMGAVPDEIASSSEPLVEQIYLKETAKFKEGVASGRIRTEADIRDFIGKHMVMHQPDTAMAGEVKVDGESFVKGKGGVYYPVLFSEDGYFWASTAAKADEMAGALNEIGERNGGSIYMALTSADVDKLFSSTTMSVGTMNFFKQLTKNPRKYGITEIQLNKMLINASKAQVVKKTLIKDKDKKPILNKKGEKTYNVKIQEFGHTLSKGTNLEQTMTELEGWLQPFSKDKSTGSSFDVRKAFVFDLMRQASAHLNARPAKAEAVAELLTQESNKYVQGDLSNKKLGLAAFSQGLGDMLSEPLTKTFQQFDANKRTGYVYAVIEIQGKVKAIDTDGHESYPKAIVSAEGNMPIVHVMKKGYHWTDVVQEKDSGARVERVANKMNKVYPTGGFSAYKTRPIQFGDVQEGAEGVELSFSMDDTARQGIMESIEERVTLPEIKAEMLGDAFRNVQKLVDQKNKLQEELKTINDDGKTQAVVNLEEKLRQIEVEIDTMDQAYDNDVKEIEALHEIRKGDIGEQVVSEFAHRIEKAKPQQKKQLTKEAKARESERKKAETTRFKLEKKNLKERLKTEKANLENEAERVRTKLETKSAMARRKLIRDMLVTYEAILMSLNTSERGKMGSSVRLADISSDQQILDFFEQKLDRLERVMDSFIGKKFNKSKDQLMKRAKVKTQAGKKDKGKLKAQIHEVFDAANRATKMDESELAASVAYIDTLIEGKEGETELTGAEVDILRKQKVMMQLFGNWKELTNPEKEAALVNGWREFEYNFALSKLEQAEDRAKRLAEVETAIQSTGVTSEEANLIADLKEGESHKLMSKLRATAYGLMDFEQFLTKVFGKDSRILDFVVREQKADAQKIDRMKSHQDALSDMFEEVAGTSNLGVKAAKLQYEMQQKKYLIKSGQRSLTHMQMIQARLMWRQVDGRRHMEGRFDADGNRITSWGYDQKFMDEIDSLMTPEARAVEDFLIEQYKDEWADLNAVHQRMQNATLPRNDMYAPLTVEPARGVKDPDPITGQSIKTMKGADAFLLRRNKSAVAEPKFRDALSTFLAHKTQVEHYMAYAELNRDINNIVGNREARKSIRAKTGDEGIKTLDGWTNVFENNGLQQSYADTELANFMNRAVSRTSQAILFGRLSVLAIQSTQIGAAAAQMPTMSYAKRLGMLMTGQLEFKKAFNSAFIQRRMDEAPPAVKLAMQHMASGKPNLARAAAERMGTLISGTDAFFTAGTYAIIFDYLTSNKGLADKDAHAEAERLTEQVAQPMRMGRKSLMEMQFSRQPTAKLAWAFASEPRQKMMLLAFNISENGLVSKEAGRAAITTVAFGGVFASLIRTIAADVRDDDDEEIFDAKYWNPYRLALQSVTAPLQGIPVFGDIAEYLLLSSFKAVGVDTGYLFSGGDMLSGAKDMGMSGVKLAVSLADVAQQSPDAEIEASLKHLDRFLSGMGVFNNNAAAASSFSHLLKDLFMMGKNIAK